MGKTKAPKSSDEVDVNQNNLTIQDFEDELDNREHAMFWDSLDIETSKVALLKLFIIRFAFIMAQVHLKKHPDEIQQGKEIAYKILNGQSIVNPNGV
jgi:hypothetical protein